MNFSTSWFIPLIIGFFAGIWSLTIIGYSCYIVGKKVGNPPPTGQPAVTPITKVKLLPDLDPVVPTGKKPERD